MPTNIPRDFWKPRSWYGSEDEVRRAILPPFDQYTLTQCQKRLGVMLPLSLVNLLHTQNGGCTEYNELICEQPTLWGDTEVSFRSIPGICAERVWVYGLENFEIDFGFALDPGGERMTALKEKVGAPQRLIPLCRDAHSMVALDYRSCPYSDDPPVIWLTFDEECDFVQIASNFESLLSRLRKSED